MHEDISPVAAYRKYATFHFSTRKLFSNKLLKAIFFLPPSASYTVTYQTGPINNNAVVKQL